MIVDIFDTQTDLPLDPTKIKQVVQEALCFLKIRTDLVHIYFLSNEDMCQLHNDLFDDPSKTDCITLPFDLPFEEENGFHFLGESFICPYVAIEYAKEAQLDPYEETTLYIVHSLLHLIGFEDKTEEGIDKMRLFEKKVVGYLQKKELKLR